jgi:hypothetical protein
VSRSQVDDAEAAVRKTDWAFDVDARIVGATVLQNVPHANEDCLAHINPASGRVRYAANAAHALGDALRRTERRAHRRG